MHIRLKSLECQPLRFEARFDYGLPTLPKNLRFAVQGPVLQRSVETRSNRCAESLRLQRDVTDGEILQCQGKVGSRRESPILIVNLGRGHAEPFYAEDWQSGLRGRGGRYR